MNNSFLAAEQNKHVRSSLDSSQPQKKHTDSTLVSIINCKRVTELHYCLGVLIAILNSDFLQFIWLAVHIKDYMQDFADNNLNK